MLIFTTDKMSNASQWRTQKIFMGEFHSVACGGRCIWCALFVTSQFYVTIILPNQRFGEVC